MARTISELRKFHRERRAVQRAAARAAGVPPADRVTASIGEATAFAMRSGVKSPGVNIEQAAGAHLWIDTGLVLVTAVDILVRRGGFDPARSREAVARIVSPRPEHLWPQYIPSHTKTIYPAADLS